MTDRPPFHSPEARTARVDALAAAIDREQEDAPTFAELSAAAGADAATWQLFDDALAARAEAARLAEALAVAEDAARAAGEELARTDEAARIARHAELELCAALDAEAMLSARLAEALKVAAEALTDAAGALRRHGYQYDAGRVCLAASAARAAYDN